LQETFATVEGAMHGLAFSTGIAAVDCIMNLLRSGDHVVTGDDIYGGTYRYLEDVAERRGITFDYVNMYDEAAVEAAIKPNTKMIWFESPTNPLLNLVDIEMVARLGKKHDVLTVIDNTFATPICQQPLGMGIDIVMHSATKYLNGHSDVIMGAVMVNDTELYDQLKSFQNAIGPTPSPFECFLAQRGLKTLAIRMQRHQENAMKVAQFLEQHPKVEEVLYPGLPGHRHHELAKKQMSGFSGMVSFKPKTDLEGTIKVLNATEIFILAVSLGGVESLIEQPATMTHFEMPEEVRKEVGITDNLIRLSIGIENADDLIADLDQALSVI
jgi:cystathionine beta-lyase/cystathionine gamma-synthase